MLQSSLTFECPGQVCMGTDSKEATPGCAAARRGPERDITGSVPKDIKTAVPVQGCRVAERMAEAASPRRADAQPLESGGSLPEEESSAFECNICYEIAQSPVVTLCGHLYCWPCLYRCADEAVAPGLCVSRACWQVPSWFQAALGHAALSHRGECVQVDAGAEPMPCVPRVQGWHRAGQGTVPSLALKSLQL